MTVHRELVGTHCVVLGVESQIGLCLVRELAEAGVKVIAMSDKPNAIGLASNKAWRRVVCGPARSPIWLETLRALGAELPRCSLLTVSEVNLQWLSDHRQDLGALHLALPEEAALEAVLDKQRTLAAATQVGIRTPITAEPALGDELEALAREFPFPAVLKWKDPNAVARQLEAAGLPLLKAEYVYNSDELLAAGRRYAHIGAMPLVQQYCRGVGLGQFLFMDQGRSLRHFQHLRIAEWPPEGGFSSVCDTLPENAHRDLMQQSEALLRHIGWSGVAMVEYRWDAQRNQAWLMEINGRFWGSFPLAYHAGAGFALLQHAAALGITLPTLPPTAHPLRCRMLSTELKRLLRLLLQPSRIIDKAYIKTPWHDLFRFLVDFIKPRRRYYVWQWRDPKPWWADIKNILRRS